MRTCLRTHAKQRCLREGHLILKQETCVSEIRLGHHNDGVLLRSLEQLAESTSPLRMTIIREKLERCWNDFGLIKTGFDLIALQTSADWCDLGQKFPWRTGLSISKSLCWYLYKYIYIYFKKTDTKEWDRPLGFYNQIHIQSLQPNESLCSYHPSPIAPQKTNQICTEQRFNFHRAASQAGSFYFRSCFLFFVFSQKERNKRKIYTIC